MHRASTQLLVAVLVWSLTPGLNEFAENVWHLAVSGHTAHAIEQGEDHAPEGDEHGCSGTFHLCSCHHSPPTELVRQPDAFDPAAGARQSGRATTPPAEPFLAGLLRPPQA